MSSMFSDYVSLVTIYCDNDGWDISKVTSSSYMFANCHKLVGAISYNSSKVDVTCVNPDTGYFTRKSA